LLYIDTVQSDLIFRLPRKLHLCLAIWCTP